MIEPKFTCPVCDKTYHKPAYGYRHVYVEHLEFYSSMAERRKHPFAATGKKCWCGDRMTGINFFSIHCVEKGGIHVHYHASLIGATTVSGGDAG